MKVGDRCHVARYGDQITARVIAIAEGYALLRYSHFAPFVEAVCDLVPAIKQPTVVERLEEIDRMLRDGQITDARKGLEHLHKDLRWFGGREFSIQIDWHKAPHEVVTEGGITITIYPVNDEFAVADQAGWLPGIFSTRDAALASARAANGLS